MRLLNAWLLNAWTISALAASPWLVHPISVLAKRLFAPAPKPRHPLLLSTFKIFRTVKDDVWNKRPGTEYWCRIIADDHDPNAKAAIREIGHFEYRTTVGQVAGIYLDPEYRDRLLDEQILIYMMKDMQDAGATHIWEVCPEQSKYWNRIVYDGLWDFQYKSEQGAWKGVHLSVSGGGYIMPIPKDPRELRIIDRTSEQEPI